MTEEHKLRLMHELKQVKYAREVILFASEAEYLSQLIDADLNTNQQPKETT